MVKMRRSQHSIDMCEYRITPQGLVLGEPLRGYRALTSGIPGPWPDAADPALRQDAPAPEGESHA